MPTRVIVAVPTLLADDALGECLESLAAQTFRDIEVVVVDNSGRGAVRGRTLPAKVQVIENSRNVGFGAAVNQAFRATGAPFCATLNDDAMAHPNWMEALMRDADAHPETGMWASCVKIRGGALLDSAGMLLCPDGTSKQRGHGRPAAEFSSSGEVLLPSGSAALYRRAMLDAVGMFDESFFLYCEDTDLGLRARWAGWGCRYVADAVAEHRYSHSSGKGSPLKVYHVERNRLRAMCRNLPAAMLAAAPWFACERYFWHWAARNKGSAAGEFLRSGSPAAMAWMVVKAHLALVAAIPRLVVERREIRRRARIGSSEFTALARRFRISPREVASQ